MKKKGDGYRKAAKPDYKTPPFTDFNRWLSAGQRDLRVMGVRVVVHAHSNAHYGNSVLAHFNLALLQHISISLWSLPPVGGAFAA